MLTSPSAMGFGTIASLAGQIRNGRYPPIAHAARSNSTEQSNYAGCVPVHTPHGVAGPDGNLGAAVGLSRCVPLPRSTRSGPRGVGFVRDGGTIWGYAAFAHVRHTTAAERLRRGLGALADHYKLAKPRTP